MKKKQRLEGGEIKNVRESREVKKKKNKESWREEVKGKAQERQRENKEKPERQLRISGQRRKRKIKSEAENKGEFREGIEAIPCMCAHGYACAHTLWWMALFVMCSPAWILGAAILTASPLH